MKTPSGLIYCDNCGVLAGNEEPDSKRALTPPDGKLPPVDVIRGKVDGVSFACLTIAGIATCELRLRGECAELRAMFVAEEYRRRGLGKTLFQAAARVAEEAGKRSMNWTVRKENKDALAFYERMRGEIFFDDFDDYWMAVLFRRSASKVVVTRGIPLEIYG